MMNNLWVFDLDNTLIPTTHDYAGPILASCREIIEVLGEKAPHVFQIVAMEQEIDKRRVKETNPKTGKPYYYSMERFPGSLVETYNQICARVGVKPVFRVQESLYRIGLGAFDEKRYGKNLKDGAIDAISFLRIQSDIRNFVALLTKGDRFVQQRKIDALTKRGIEFDFIEVVDDGEKKPAHFHGIAEKFGGCDRKYSVGDSYEFDIMPAIEADFRGIWLPVETWDVIGRMDDVRNKVDRTKCFELSSLRDLIKKYKEFT